MIIDFHAHAFDDKIAGNAIVSLKNRSQLWNFHDGTITGLLASMNRANIDVSVVLPVATKPAQTRTINDWAARANEIPGIVSFGTVHPDYADWKNELLRIRDELGLKGIKFHPDYQNFYIDDTKMLPIYKYALDLGLIIIFHSGVDIGLPPPVHCTPRRISNIIGIFRGQKVVFAHMGAYNMYANAEQMLIGEDVFIDTSMAISQMKNTTARRFITKHNPDKILFGTDTPWTDQASEVAFMHSLDLSQSDLSKIMCRNAAKLLGLE